MQFERKNPSATSNIVDPCRRRAAAGRLVRLILIGI